MWNVAILALIPGLAVASRSGQASKPDADDAPKGLRMAISATTERIPLPGSRGTVELEFDALSRRIRLKPSKKDSVTLLAERIGKHAGVVCPRVVVKRGAVEMTCRTARIEAQITSDKKQSFLDINELRGLPWRQGLDGPPLYYYDPWRVGLGQSCPGKSPAARGECELKKGHQLEAAVQFRAALGTSGRQIACVRLGDLAAATGDPITAAGWYRRAGSFGSFGRIADQRLCELEGDCLASTERLLHTFDPSGMPEPLRAETLMHAARAEAYMGRLVSAVQIIARQARAHGMGSICREDGLPLCRRILLEAMRGAVAETTLSAPPKHLPPLDEAERGYLEELLETYLAIPSWDEGPLAVEMVQVAGPLAARLGAPEFGGNLLASLAPHVSDDQLSDHLLLTAETFMKGSDWARARIIVEYAQSRLGTRRKGNGKASENPLRNPRWIALTRALALRAERDDVSPAVRTAIEAELTATLAELKTAHAVLDNADSVLKGTREARAPGRGAATKGGGAASGAGAAQSAGAARNAAAASASGAGSPAPGAPSAGAAPSPRPGTPEAPAAKTPPAVARNGEEPE